MIIGIPSEIKTGEKRVAMSPANVQSLTDKSVKVLIQADAGSEAGYPDAEYTAAGATITVDRAEIFASADIILQVQSFGSNNENSDGDVALIRKGQLIIGMMDPLASPQAAQAVADKGATAIALELVPRISRAQSMDVLSSMATLAGYKAVLMGASAAPRIFPMLMTAAGTLQPARVLIMGVGVAGLQACATAKRLGAVVEAYDVRPAAREQILSVGAKPVELDLDTGESEGAGGYAKEQGEDYIKQKLEDLDTIQKGFVGYKGRVHIAFGDPIVEQYENADSLAEAIDRQVYTNYKLFPSNIVACQILGYTQDLDLVKSQWPDQDWQDAELRFKDYLNRAPGLYRKIITEGYAAPVLNYLKVQSAQKQGS